jgi:hypothetical protein
MTDVVGGIARGHGGRTVRVRCAELAAAEDAPRLRPRTGLIVHAFDAAERGIADLRVLAPSFASAAWTAAERSSRACAAASARLEREDRAEKDGGGCERYSYTMHRGLPSLLVDFSNRRAAPLSKSASGQCTDHGNYRPMCGVCNTREASRLRVGPARTRGSHGHAMSHVHCRYIIVNITTMNMVDATREPRRPGARVDCSACLQ